MKLNFSKTDQYGSGKLLPISQELSALIYTWGILVGSEGCILKSINRHGHTGSSLNPASINTILKALQKDSEMDSDEQPLSGHSFRVGAALDLLDHGEPLERIMLRAGWQTDSTAMKYLVCVYCGLMCDVVYYNLNNAITRTENMLRKVLSAYIGGL